MLQPTRRRRPPSAADVELSRAREALNAALDALGDRRPSREELTALVGLASRAFTPHSAAARLLAILWTSN